MKHPVAGGLWKFISDFGRGFGHCKALWLWRVLLLRGNWLAFFLVTPDLSFDEQQ